MVSLLEQLLNQVKARESEVTIDAEDCTPERIDQIKTAAKARGFHVSGTDRWLLIRDLSPPKTALFRNSAHWGLFVWLCEKLTLPNSPRTL